MGKIYKSQKLGKETAFVEKTWLTAVSLNICTSVVCLVNVRRRLEIYPSFSEGVFVSYSVSLIAK
jgi:hypothetical protein